MPFIENVGRRSKVKGDTSTIVHVGNKSFNGYERKELYRNLGNGRYADVGFVEGADRIEDARGLGLLDIEADGDLDLVIQSFDMKAVLLVNRTADRARAAGSQARANWLEVRLEGTKSNRDAIGAWVEVMADGRRLVREVVSTAGYLSGQSRLLHFGLGGAAKVDVTVLWPSGEKTSLHALKVNQRLRSVEGGHIAAR